MIPAPAYFIGVALVTFAYCLFKAIGDLRARRWALGLIGLLVALVAAATILEARYALEWWAAR